jgi:hypothetical protein
MEDVQTLTTSEGAPQLHRKQDMVDSPMVVVNNIPTQQWDATSSRVRLHWILERQILVYLPKGN